MNVLSLFDGISCGQVALNRAQVPYENYYASEIDSYAIKITQKNYQNTIQLGDILTVKSENLPNIDLLIGGSPCQGFSFAGKQLNFDDPRSKLFFEYVRLLKELKPKYFLLENVRMQKPFSDAISDLLGVPAIEINSKLVSAQNRPRLYWTNIPFRPIIDQNISLSSIVGSYDGIFVVPRGANRGGIKSYNGKSPCITTSSWQHNFKVVQNGGIRMFTPNEVEQLQNLPINYTEGVSDNQRYKMLGNGWTVDVIAHIFSGLVPDSQLSTIPPQTPLEQVLYGSH
jgi:DNA (cytosine-5)-methyltransferase 3A